MVREKVHPAVPMSLDQALLEMELVGHDFYLFIDSEHQPPSVVYRRKAYDYGVIRLDTAGSGSTRAPARTARSGADLAPPHDGLRRVSVADRSRQSRAASR